MQPVPNAALAHVRPNRCLEPTGAELDEAAPLSPAELMEKVSADLFQEFSPERGLAARREDRHLKRDAFSRLGLCREKGSSDQASTALATLVIATSIAHNWPQEGGCVKGTKTPAEMQEGAMARQGDREGKECGRVVEGS